MAIKPWHEERFRDWVLKAQSNISTDAIIYVAVSPDGTTYVFEDRMSAVGFIGTAINGDDTENDVG